MIKGTTVFRSATHEEIHRSHYFPWAPACGNVLKFPLVKKKKDLTWQNVPLIATDIFFFSNKFNWKEVEFTLNGQKKRNRCDKMIDYL